MYSVCFKKISRSLRLVGDVAPTPRRANPPFDIRHSIFDILRLCGSLLTCCSFTRVSGKGDVGFWHLTPDTCIDYRHACCPSETIYSERPLVKRLGTSCLSHGSGKIAKSPWLFHSTTYPTRSLYVKFYQYSIWITSPHSTRFSLCLRRQKPGKTQWSQHKDLNLIH